MQIMSKVKLLLGLLLMLAVLVACGEGNNSKSDNGDGGHGHSDSGHHADDGNLGTVPNNGATIEIISPSDGAIFKVGEEIIVEVEVENFELGVDGNHWHIDNQGVELMVMGANTDEVLRDLEAGEHIVKVALSNGNHEELEDGDSITITVEE